MIFNKKQQYSSCLYFELMFCHSSNDQLTWDLLCVRTKLADTEHRTSIRKLHLNWASWIEHFANSDYIHSISFYIHPLLKIQKYKILPPKVFQFISSTYCILNGVDGGRLSARILRILRILYFCSCFHLYCTICGTYPPVI